MATFSATFHPSQENSTGTIPVASAVTVTVGQGRIFAINANQDVMIRFGNAGMASATASDYRIVANTVAQFDTGTGITSISLFNNGAALATFWIQFLTKS